MVVQGLCRGIGSINDVLGCSQGRGGEEQKTQQNQGRLFYMHTVSPFQIMMVDIIKSVGITGNFIADS
jgi:hypothetical protein